MSYISMTDPDPALPYAEQMTLAQKAFYSGDPSTEEFQTFWVALQALISGFPFASLLTQGLVMRMLASQITVYELVQWAATGTLN